MTQPIPVTTIGGFLGAGKTTLVNHALRHADGLRLCVLVNEFGELPIDSDLIEAEGEDMIAIAGGCICCAFGDNLTGALMDLAQLSPQPDHIVIEASGVALPGAIAASIGLSLDYRMNGTVVLADAETIRDMAQDRYLGDTIQRQLADADLALITKPDLIPNTEMPSLRRWMATHAPKAAIVPALHGAVPMDLLLGPRDSAPRALEHADAMFCSAVVTPSEPLAAEKLAHTLAQDPTILRAKGTVMDLSGTRQVIQIAGHRHSLFPAPPNAAPGLVVIGLRDRLDTDHLSQLIP